MDGHGLRQFGVQETDILPIVAPLTKHCERVMDPERIGYELRKAHDIATTGRPGPVWIDVPLDVQGASIESRAGPEYVSPFRLKNSGLIGGAFVHTGVSAAYVQEFLRAAKRPVIISGNGIHLAGGENVFRDLVGLLSLPVVTSWTGADLLESDHSCHIGHCGIFGDRASNFAVQNADLLLVLGSRLSIPQIGHNFQHFARGAKIVMVDIDRREIEKPSLKVDIPIVGDVKEFMTALFVAAKNPTVEQLAWLSRCKEWKAKYPVLAENV